MAFFEEAQEIVFFFSQKRFLKKNVLFENNKLQNIGL